MKSSAQRVRLAVVVTDLGTGGAESLLSRLLPRLTGRFDITVYSLRTTGVHGETLARHGIAVHALGVSSSLSLPRALHRLTAQLRATAPSIVQSHLYHADLIGGWAAHRAGIRSVIWGIHNSGLGWATMKPATRAVIRACAWSSRKIPNRIVTCSQSAIAQHVAVGYDPDRFNFIPNGFDLEQFAFDPTAAASVRQELDIPSGSPIVGMVARMDPQKDHATFVAMAGLLHRQRPDVHFVLVGHGVDEVDGQVSAQIAQAGIGSVCRLLGRRPDVARLMSGFDVLVSSSMAEAFPLVIGEAMATTLPCVATDVGDSAYLLGDTGRIVPPKDPHGLASATIDLLSLSPASRRMLGERGRARIAKCFDLNLIATQYETLYLEELARSGSR